MKKEKIFIGIHEVAGYFQNLFLGFKDLGLDAGYLNLSPNKFEYNDYINQNYKILNFAIKQMKLIKNGKKYLQPFLFLYQIIIRLIIFVWVLFKFDIFIFSSSKSFFYFYDCLLIKLLRKRIIFVSLGSDSRPSFLNGKYKDDDSMGEFNSKKCFIENKKIELTIRKVEKYASYIINYPQHGQFHTRKFISGNHIGFPTKSTHKSLLQTDSYFNKTTDYVKIIHAPTRPNAKGSIEFKKIIENLIEEGEKINYVELKGKTNLEVLNEIKSCDIVLDELYSDLPLGGLGCEAAIFAKPVIVFGYYANEIKIDNEIDSTPPSFYSDPIEVESIIKKLVKSKKLREESGKKLYNFVLNNWNRTVIAQKYLQIIDDEVPEFWKTDPYKITYLYGWGLSKEELKSNLKKLINDFGIDSLRLNHNQELKNCYSKLISN